jgi:hypothetical protein
MRISNRQKFIQLCEKYNLQYTSKEDRPKLDLYTTQPYEDERCWLMAYKSDTNRIIVANYAYYGFDGGNKVGYFSATPYKSTKQIEQLIKEYNEAVFKCKEYELNKKIEAANADFG